VPSFDVGSKLTLALTLAEKEVTIRRKEKARETIKII
jgi:hypothetical protein